MITITKHLKINPLTIFLFAFSSFFHYPVIFFITYAVMGLHECAHTAAAVCIGLKVDCIVMQPFGLNLQLKNKLVPSLAEEIILYISGPLVNAFFALASAAIYVRTGIYEWRLAYMTNLALFIINLLPAAPLDGGLILRAILVRTMGCRTAFIICSAVSAVLCCAITALGIFAAAKSRNFSVLLFAALIIGNLFTQKEKYRADYLKETARRYMESEM